MSLSLCLLSSSLSSPAVWANSPPSSEVHSLQIPDHLGYITETFLPPSKPETRNAKLVIHIQDLHAHYGAQRAIQALISHLHDHAGVSLVALEGGAGSAELEDVLQPFPPSARVVDFLLQQGLVTGPIAQAMTRPGHIHAVGVEDAALYLEHLHAYQRREQRRAATVPRLESLLSFLRSLQETVYSTELRAFLARRQAHEAGTLPLIPYLEQLTALAAARRVSVEAYPTLQSLQELARLERAVDRHTVGREHQQLITRLRTTLSAEARDLLAQAQRALKAGTLSTAQYYLLLPEFARRVGIDPAPHLSAYLQVLQRSRAIAPDQVAGELAHFAEAVNASLLDTESARRLDALTRLIARYHALLTATLSRNEWADYQQHRDQYTAAHVTSLLDALVASQVTRHRSPVTHAELEAVFSERETDERFYRLAAQRDEALVANTLKQMEAQHQDVAVLVAGGFHTDGMTRLLKEQGIAYLVITPTLALRAQPETSASTSDTKRYHELLLGRVPSIETLLRAFLTGPAHASAHAAAPHLLPSHQGALPPHEQPVDDQNRVWESHHACLAIATQHLEIADEIAHGKQEFGSLDPHRASEAGVTIDEQQGTVTVRKGHTTVTATYARTPGGEQQLARLTVHPSPSAAASDAQQSRPDHDQSASQAFLHAFAQARRIREAAGEGPPLAGFVDTMKNTIQIPRGAERTAVELPQEYPSEQRAEAEIQLPKGASAHRAAPGTAFRAMIFDSDGVIVDTSAWQEQAWRDVLEPYGLHVTTELYNHYLNAVWSVHAFQRLAADGLLPAPLTDEEVAVVVERQGDRLRQLIGSTVPTFPTTRIFLESLRRNGIPVAVASGSAQTPDVLAQADIKGRLVADEAIVTVADVTPGSSLKLATFLLAAERLGVRPADAAMIGDTLRDVEAGVQGGFGLIIFVDRERTPTSRRQALDAGADWVIDDVSELTKEGIDKWFARHANKIAEPSPPQDGGSGTTQGGPSHRPQIRHPGDLSHEGGPMMPRGATEGLVDAAFQEPSRIMKLQDGQEFPFDGSRHRVSAEGHDPSEGLDRQREEVARLTLQGLVQRQAQDPVYAALRATLRATNERLEAAGQEVAFLVTSGVMATATGQAMVQAVNGMLGPRVRVIYLHTVAESRAAFLARVGIDHPEHLFAEQIDLTAAGAADQGRARLIELLDPMPMSPTTTLACSNDEERAQVRQVAPEAFHLVVYPPEAWERRERVADYLWAGLLVFKAQNRVTEARSGLGALGSGQLPPAPNPELGADIAGQRRQMQQAAIEIGRHEAARIKRPTPPHTPKVEDDFLIVMPALSPTADVSAEFDRRLRTAQALSIGA